MLIATLLSHYNFIGVSIGVFSSLSIHCNHNNSQAPLAIVLYSASSLLLSITFCFLLLQLTRFCYTYVQYPEVDFLSVIELV